MRRLLLLLLPLLALFSCDNKIDARGHVGILFPDKSSSSRWINEANALSTMFVYSNYTVSVGLTGDVSEQAGYIKSLTSMQCRYLVLASLATNSQDINNALVEFRAAGGKVLCYDRLQNTPNVDYYITVMPQDVGALQAPYVAKVPRGSKIEFISGPTADDNSIGFFNGAMATLKTNLDAGYFSTASGKTTFEQTAMADWTTQSAKTYTAELLSRYYPDRDMPAAFLVANDEQAQGVVEALKLHINGIVDFPVITGQDNTLLARERIKNGEQTMTVNKFSNKYVTETFAIINDYWVAGKAFPDNQYKYNGIMCTKINPISVDKTNI